MPYAQRSCNCSKNYQLWLLVLVAMLIGCSGTRIGHQAPTLEQIKAQQEKIDDLQSPIKVFRVDGSIFLFRKGAHVSSSSVWGTADVLTPEGKLDTGVRVTLAASEIAGATLYEFKQSAGSAVGAVFTGALGAYSWFSALICIANPKTCFGSCPTVYVPHKDSMLMVAELFSTSISPSLSRNDLDRLCTIDGDAAIPIMITNEALESHYIDKVQFVYIPHLPSQTALPQPDGSIVISGRQTLKMTARSSLDNDVTRLLTFPDDSSWRSGPIRLLTMPVEDPFDHVEITTFAPNVETVQLRLRWKNTLLSTMLFYSMVLGDQGLHALAWQQRLDTDPLYSTAFSAMYDRYSGIRVQVWDGTYWVEQAHMTDAGPIVWHEGAVTIPTCGLDTVRIRLCGLADNVEIDAVEVGMPSQIDVEEIPLHVELLWTTGPKGRDVGVLLDSTDGRYLIQEPGESTSLLVQPPSRTRHGTVFVRSHGWYYEWVRKTWIDPEEKPRALQILNGEAMIRELGRRWMDEHMAIEASFHQLTIPLRKP